MPTLMNPQTWSWLGPTIVSGCAALLALYAIGKWVVPRIRKAGHLLDDLFGEPGRPGHSERPGLMQQMANHTERLSCLESRTNELLTNSGTSIKDAVTRIDSRVSEMSRKMEDVDKTMFVIQYRLSEVERSVK